MEQETVSKLERQNNREVADGHYLAAQTIQALLISKAIVNV